MHGWCVHFKKYRQRGAIIDPKPDWLGYQQRSYRKNEPHYVFPFLVLRTKLIVKNMVRVSVVVLTKKAVTCHGWLEKKRQKRYFVLRDNILWWFIEEPSVDLVQRFILTYCRTCTPILLPRPSAEGVFK